VKNLIFIILILPFLSYGSGSIIGNGDNGEDLEGFKLVTSGRLLSTRELAIKTLKKLNVSSIKHLGNLFPEVSNTKIYITKRNIKESELEKLGAYETGRSGFIYARTFPRAYASTRFFPKSLELSNSQLIALHIHEGLHRSLPSNYREDEKTVTAITLAITTPNSSFDLIEDKVKHLIQDTKNKVNMTLPKIKSISKNNKVTINSYLFKVSNLSEYSSIEQQLELKNILYPINGYFNSLGIELGFSVLKIKNESLLGPIELGFRGQIGTLGNFKVEANIAWMRETGNLSNESQILSVRDSFKVGAILTGKFKKLEMTNSIYFIKDKTSKKVLNNKQYSIDFPSVTLVEMKAIKELNKFKFGSYVNIILAGSYESKTLNVFTGRRSFISLGPQLSYDFGTVKSTITTNILLSKLSNKNFSADLNSLSLAQDYIKLSFDYMY